MKRALLIAYHFPPMTGSSGVERTLRFAQYLPEYGWQAAVLTVHPRAHPQVGQDWCDEILKDVPVRRAFALDAARHLAVLGKYPRQFALPDRWVSWRFGGVWAGIRLIHDFKPDVVWSTYPIPTAHVIGRTLAQKAKLPWIADFRDPMVEENSPKDEFRRKKLLRLDSQVVHQAGRVVFTTPGTLRLYSDRYPEIPKDRWEVIENGFDGSIFDQIGTPSPYGGRKKKINLLHSGVVYPSERDPRQFFTALSRMRSNREISSDNIRIVLRASGHDHLLAQMISDYRISDIVSIRPRIDHEQAVIEMLQADGLLLLQASNCNDQIPAKLYEYLRAGRPILALTDPVGDTAQFLTSLGYRDLARLDDANEIERALRNFIVSIQDDKYLVANRYAVSRFSRRVKTADLARIFETVIS